MFIFIDKMIIILFCSKKSLPKKGKNPPEEGYQIFSKEKPKSDKKLLLFLIDDRYF